MNRYYAVLVILGLALSGCASKPTHESLTEKMITAMEEMVETLKSARDEASAKAAAERYARLIEEVKALKAQAMSLGEPTPEQKAALKAKYDVRMKEIILGILKESLRLAGNPQLSQYFKDLAPPSIN